MTEQLVEAGDSEGHLVGHPISSGMVWVPLGVASRSVATLLMPAEPLRNYGRGANLPAVFEAELPEDFSLWPGPVPVDLRDDPSMYWTETPVGLRVESTDGPRDISSQPLGGALEIPQLLPMYPPRGPVTGNPGYAGDYELEPLTPVGILFGPSSAAAVLWIDTAGGERGWGGYVPGVLAHRHSAVANESLMVVGQRVVGYREIAALAGVQAAVLNSRYYGAVADF